MYLTKDVRFRANDWKNFEFYADVLWGANTVLKSLKAKIYVRDGELLARETTFLGTLLVDEKQ